MQNGPGRSVWAAADRCRTDRRGVLRAVSLAAVTPHLLTDGVAAQDGELPLNRFPRMVHEFFVRQVRDAERRRLQRLARLETQQDAERYVEHVRRQIRTSFGPEPERTPLNARITGTLERDTYTVEKLIFESRPGFPVTANLYLPRGLTAPAPGVVGTCGHSSNGKAAEPYQAFAQGLARQGYVCLIYDPIGQGERTQYPARQTRAGHGGGVSEHLLAGNQQFLVGEFLGSWRAWDGIRALDYLLTRPEVDGSRVGVTGNSGGGTMTTWLCGVESRWTMAAPSCFVTTFRRNLENELPADTEQCPPRAIALGLDHADFIAAMAPKPVVLLAKEKDYFDARGAEQAFAQLQQIYSLLQRPDEIDLFVGPTTHGYSLENREAMYRWFHRATKASDADGEPQLTIEKDEALWCTESGRVADMPAKTVFGFTAERARQLAEKRQPLSAAALSRAVRSVLRLPQQSAGTPDFRILRDWRARGYPRPQGITYAVETEPDVQAIVYMLTEERWYSRPPRSGKEALLYVSHRSSDAELRSESILRDAVAADPQRAVFTCDVRGIGESQPDTCGTNSFDRPYGCDYFYAIHSLMLDRPYVGQKTLDVMRVLDWMAAYGYTDVHVMAKGWGALPATFASLLHSNVTRVTLKNALTSYRDIAETENYRWPLATLLPGVLLQFDLPDCYAALAGRDIRLIEPWNALAEA